MDAFLDMMPAHLFGHPEGLVFETFQDQDKPSIAIQSGPVVQNLMRGMRHAIAAMATQGNNLIVDDVLLEPEDAEDYRTLLAPLMPRLVGLFAPLEVLEDREHARGDRAIGLARWQYGRVHRGVAYDLELDAAKTTPEENARKIRDVFGL